MITKEGQADSAGQIRIGAVCRSENGHCNICGSALLLCNMLRQHKVAYICDNIYCYAFRSPVYYVNMPPSIEARKRKRPK